MNFADNPKATFDYEILETVETGLVLLGHEVKAIRTGKASIKGSYVKILGGEAYLVGAQIAPYQTGNVGADYDPERSRKLLVKKSELEYLLGKSQERGLTLLPLRLYGQKGLVKLAVGIARGKKKYDKRESIKKREFERSLKR